MERKWKQRRPIECIEIPNGQRQRSKTKFAFVFAVMYGNPYYVTYIVDIHIFLAINCFDKRYFGAAVVFWYSDFLVKILKRLWSGSISASVTCSMVAKDLFVTIQKWCEYLQYMVEWWQQTSSDHPNSWDGWSQKVFCPYPGYLDGHKKPFATIQILKRILKQMRISSVFISGVLVTFSPASPLHHHHSPDEWNHVIEQQHRLHELELERWKDVLTASVSLVDQVL